MVSLLGDLEPYSKQFKQSSLVRSMQRHACLAISSSSITTPSATMKIFLGVPHPTTFVERDASWAACRIAYIAICTNQVYAEPSTMLVSSESCSLLEMTSDLKHTTANLRISLIITNGIDWILRKMELLSADS